MLFTDSHCHIDFKEFDGNRDALLASCAKENIHALIVPGVEPSRWESQIAHCLENHSNVKLLPALGIHPWFIDGLSDNCISQLDQHLNEHSDSVVAVGEIGLDGKIADYERQKVLFSEQLNLANKYKLPIIVHHRKSHQDLVPILKASGHSYGGVIHAFSGSYQQAMHYVELGYKLGIGGTITYERAEKTRKAIKRLPLESLVLETDAPAMPLNGYQGKINTPLQLKNVFYCLTELLNIQEEQLANQLELNVKAAFQF